ncbi:MAG: glycosyltransferase [Ignavibacteriales bacterium]|nr:glycosyltransferase [Ignavibacteriales bacterium]
MAKLLLIGPRTTRKNPEKTGGVIVLFEQLIYELKETNTEMLIIDANSANYGSRKKALLNIIYKMIKTIPKVDHVSLHGTATSYIFVAPFAIILAKLFHKTLSLRKFAGNFNQFYEISSPIRKKLIEWILRSADYSFFETKYLVEYFKKWNENTYWFPNVRKRSFLPSLPRTYNKKFVFISHVSKGKGIDQILEASQKLDKSYTIDIYGPIMQNEYTNESFKNFNVTYKGALEHTKVIQTLNNYDVLLLPSYRAEEGYPGIIIEAYSLGIPIISTTLKPIKEICTDGIEGILVEPKNVLQMVDAIQYFNNNNYKMFSENAYEKFEDFRSDLHTSSFINKLELVSDEK